MSMRAWVFVRYSGAANLGHVGWAFQWDDSRTICGATENPSGGGFGVPAKDKGAWHTCIPVQDVLREFTRTHFGCPGYDAVKVIDVANPNPGHAWNVMSWCEQQDYWVTGVPRGRNCMDDAFDVLTAMGLSNLPWPTLNPMPNGWFNAMPGALMSLKGLRMDMEAESGQERFVLPEATPVRPAWRTEGTPEYLRFVEGVEKVRAEEEAKKSAV
ncbi:MAG: repeat protein [Moraxellaceae bacterium]|jgi:hypothetical protein|nr:repeat protein [Moraxellaceae bacterium]